MGPRQAADIVFFQPFTRPAVNPGVSTGLLLSILHWAQDCSTHSCADNRIAPVHYEQLGLGTVLARAQACDGVGPAVELPGLRHVVDAQDEGQATREECVSQLRVKDQVVAPSRTIVVHAAAGENVRISVDAERVDRLASLHSDALPDSPPGLPTKTRQRPAV